MPIGKSAGQAGGNFRTTYWSHGDVERVLQHRHIKAGEMHQLNHRKVCQYSPQIGAIIAVPTKFRWDQLDQMRVSVTAGKLYQTQPIAMRIKAHGFRIDRDYLTEVQSLGEVVAMQMDGGASHELGAAHAADTSRHSRLCTRDIARLRRGFQHLWPTALD